MGYHYVHSTVGDREFCLQGPIMRICCADWPASVRLGPASSIRCTHRFAKGCKLIDLGPKKETPRNLRGYDYGTLSRRHLAVDSLVTHLYKLQAKCGNTASKLVQHTNPRSYGNLTFSHFVVLAAQMTGVFSVAHYTPLFLTARTVLTRISRGQRG